MNRTTPRPAPWAVRLYSRLTVLYPKSFRDKYGRDMVQLFADTYRDSWRVGLIARSLAALRGFSDLGACVIREQIHARRFRRSIVNHAGGRHVPSDRQGDIMERFLRDFRQSLRGLRRQPTLALTVVLLVALGVGLDVALFSVVRATLVRPLPFADPDRLLVLTGTYSGVPRWSLGVPELRDLEERSHLFEHIGIYSSGWPISATGEGSARSLTAGYASAHFFDVLAAPPALGRGFVPEEDNDVGAHPVVILGNRYWRQEMAADPEVVGSTLSLEGQTYTVVGVLGDDFRFADLDVWLPLSMGAPVFGRSFHQSRGSRWHFGVARLPKGSTIDEARRELDSLMVDLESEMPDQQRARGVHIFPLREYFYGRVEEPVKLLFAGAGLVMLICCVNIAALLLVRAIARQREMAVRAALGASRGRLLTAFVSESVLLTALGGAFGVLLAQVALKWIVASFDLGLPVFTELQLDRTALVVSVGVVLMVGLILGVYPALSQGLRSPAGALTGGGGRAGADRATKHQRSLVIALEVALALMLLVGSGLTAKSFMRLVGTDLGYDTADLLTLRLDLRGPALRTADGAETTERRMRFLQAVVEQTQALPGVRSVTTWGPTMLGSATQHMRLAPEGADFDDDGSHLFCQRLVVGPGSLANLGIALLEGRDLEPTDTFDKERVAVIDQSLATALFPNGSAVGRRMGFRQLTGVPFLYTIVGVARDVRHRGRRNDDAGDGVAGDVYLAQTQGVPGQPSLLVRTEPGLAAGAVAQSVLRAVASVRGDVPVHNIATMDERLGRWATIPRFAASLMAIYAGVATLLAFVGVYGVLAYAVRQQRTELAVRTALGADRGRLIRLVLRQGLTPVAAGMVGGTLGAVAMTRLIEGLLFGVERTDPAVYVIVALVVGLASALACYLPALRAARTEPASVLRYE